MFFFRLEFRLFICCLFVVQRKELGVLVYNCTCLALDLHRVFSLYWGLQYKDFIPNYWSKRLFPYFNRDKPVNVAFNSVEAEAYISVSQNCLVSGYKMCIFKQCEGCFFLNKLI